MFHKFFCCDSHCLDTVQESLPLLEVSQAAVHHFEWTVGPSWKRLLQNNNVICSYVILILRPEILYNSLT